MENENLKTIEKLTPFTKMIMTIGTLPSSFYASMSYYESMVWLYEYLKNQVIPTVNNNAEAVEELQTAFVELKEWTETYTEETIPEEINRKLDEMATDGTLQSLLDEIMKYKGLQAFNTIQAMKESTNLEDGSFAITYGFHSIDDLGNAKYKIREKNELDVIDEITIISLTNENLIAELLHEDVMNVKQFGAYGDNSHDDTISINKAIRYSTNIVIPNGTYLIEPTQGLNDITGLDKGIIIPSNKNIKLEENAILQCKTNDYNQYQVVVPYIADNITIDGGHIYGDKLNRTAELNEFGCPLYIYSSTNVSIKNCELAYGIGDSLTIGAIGSGSDPQNNSKNIIIENCHLHDSRRNGISVISSENTTIKDCLIENISGTNPQYGIDIESNFGDTNPTKFTTIENCIFKNNNVGDIVATQKAENVSIINCSCPKNINIYSIGTPLLIENSRIATVYGYNNNSNVTTINNSEIYYIIGTAQGSKLIFNNCIISGIYQGPISGDNYVETTFNNCLFNGDRDNFPSGGSYDALFLTRTLDILTINSCEIKVNNFNMNASQNYRLVLTNNVFNSSDGKNGFQTQEGYIKNNIFLNNFYRIVSFGTTNRASYFINNTVAKMPALLISGVIQNNLLIANNYSPSQIQIHSESVTNTYLYDNYYPNMTP